MKGLKFIIGCAILVMLFSPVYGGGGGGEEETVLAPMEMTDKEAMYAVIQGFVGNWWNGSDLYPDPCGWTPIQGVSCDLFNGFWYVISLSIGPIHDNSLTCSSNPEFKSDLFSLKHLKSLSFFSCFTSHHRHPISIPPANWEMLSDSLESLEFRSNPGLVGPIPETFGTLRNAKSLVLLENGLTGELPITLGHLKKLKRLVISQNGLTGRIPISLGGLKDLLILDLSGNSFSGSLPTSLGGMDSLMKLDLSRNQLEGELPWEFFSHLQNLTLLDLSRNKLSGELAANWRVHQYLGSLKELILSNNSIGGNLSSVEWNKLECLEILDLANMELTGGIPESLSELKWLRYMGMNGNKLTGNIPEKIGDLPRLGGMYVNGNNLTGELKFSGWFYGKMGRRFGAWGNPNMCYPVGLKSTGHVPYGVNPCQEQTDSRSDLGKGELTQVSKLGELLLLSRAGSINGVNGGLWCTLLLLVRMIMMILMHSL